MQYFFFSQSFDDFELYAQAARQWDLDFIELGLGKFHAELCILGDMELQVAEVYYNKLLFQRGTAPTNGYTFAVHCRNSAPFTWRHTDFAANSLIVFPENNELEGLSQPNHHPTTLTISENLLSIVAETLGLPEPKHFIPKGEVLDCDPSIILEIQLFMESLINIMRNSAKAYPETTIPREKKWGIAALLLSAVANSKNIHTRKRQYSQRKSTVDRILQLIEEDLSNPRSVLEYCHIAEVDERTLRNYFYEYFSLSPKKFVNRYRLNAVRASLKKSDSPHVRIGSIANAHGFWHMGQFARDYKTLFGELPSDTLRGC